MPPPLEEPEDFEQQVIYTSDVDEEGVTKPPAVTKLPRAASSPQPRIGTPHDMQYQPRQGAREVSPVPLVVSDIVRRATAVQRTALPALKPTESIKKAPKTGKKRERDPERLDQGPLTKKKKGTRREIPCAYCVRRLANDPKWVCRDALVSQHGSRNYKGARCAGCVGAHVSCHMIPDKAIESVRTLVKTAAHVAASNGTNNTQLLAAYEAAIDPALKAIVVAPDPHAPESQKRKQKSASSNPQHSNYKHQVTSNSSTPWPAYHTFSTSSAEVGAGQKQQPAQADHPANQQRPPPPPPPPPHRQFQDDAEFERLERQALRRRKVEALESISHTAALFLAEFMTFVKRQTSSPSLARGVNDEQGGGGGQDSVQAQNHGMIYAAAAAGMATSMFRHLADDSKENQSYSHRTNTGSHLNVTNHGDSDGDSSDASTIPNYNRETVLDAQIPLQQGGDDVEMNSGLDLNDVNEEQEQEQEQEEEEEVLEEEEEEEEEEETKDSAGRKQEEDGHKRGMNQGSEVKMETP